MKFRIAQALLAFLSSVLLTGITGVPEIDGLDTEPMPEEKTSVLVESLDISVSDKEPPLNIISCFSVDSDGRIAIGSDVGERKQVCVYDPDMEFLYAISFRDSGSFKVVLADNIVWVFLWRGMQYVGITPEGTVSAALELQDTSNNNRRLYHTGQDAKRQANGNTYELQNSKKILAFSGGYTQLAVTDADGNIKILYDAESVILPRLITSVLLISIVPAICFGAYCYSKGHGTGDGTVSQSDGQSDKQ